MEEQSAVNTRPYRIFEDQIGAGKKKKGFYILKKGRRKYVKRKIIVNKKKYKRRVVKPSLLFKLNSVNKKVTGDILNNKFNNSKVGKVLQDTFKNIQGNVSKIGEVNTVFNFQKDIGELKSELAKEGQKIEKIQTLVEKVKSGDLKIDNILKYPAARAIYSDLMKRPNISSEDALKETFIEFQKVLDEQNINYEDLKKKLLLANEELKNTEKEIKDAKVVGLVARAEIADTRKIENMSKKKLMGILRDKINEDQILGDRLKEVEPSFFKRDGDMYDHPTVFKNKEGVNLYSTFKRVLKEAKKEYPFKVKKTLSEIYGFEKYPLMQKIKRGENLEDVELKFDDLPDHMEDVQEEQRSAGADHDLKGMTNLDIDKVMNEFPKAKYAGTFAYDEFWDYLKNTNSDDFCCIFNSVERDNKVVGHWIAFNCDKKTRSIELNDSYGDNLGKGEWEKVIAFVARISPEIAWKYKVNNVAQQSEKSDTCGWFSINFLLLRRVNGLSFKDSTGFSNVPENERAILKLKKQFSFI